MDKGYTIKKYARARMPGTPCHVPADVRERFQREREAETILSFLENRYKGKFYIFTLNWLKGKHVAYIDENGNGFFRPLYLVRIEPDLSYFGMWDYHSGKWIDGFEEVHL